MRTLTPQLTLVDQVYESILTEITEGRLGLDSRLIQEELAETLAQMTTADMEFHYFLYQLSGNPLIGEICAPHWSYLRRVMAEVLRGETPDEIWDQHEAILNAIISGEAAKAERVARHHIAHASEVLAGRLEQHLNQNKQPHAKTLRRMNRAA